MKDREDDSEIPVKPTGVNPGYAGFQIAKAFITSEEHDDPATRERAEDRIAKWKSVLRNILSGSVEYGSRTPVSSVPAWATLEVVTGGFATGGLLASGPLRGHERKLLENLPNPSEGEERAALNAYFLTDAGFAYLQERLRTKCYDVELPEEGALLVVAWLVGHGYTEAARSLLTELSPYFSKLRFYPIPLDQPRRFDSRVHLQDVGSTINDLLNIRPNKQVLAQKEASDVWAPFYDRMVALFLETRVDDWPCQQYPPDWPERALALLGEYAELRKEHTLCGKPEKAKSHFARLRVFLGQSATKPETLTSREVGLIREILFQYVEKRGTPNSPTCIEARQRQAAYVSGPTFHEIARAVVPRLAAHPKDDGLDDINHLKQPINSEEAKGSRIPENTRIPDSIQRKVERCLNETVEVLVKRNLITSGETLARVLPQMTSHIRAASIRNPDLRQLYAAIYRAFRRRRSLLLLNLEKQIQIEELPWVAAIDRFRSENLSSVQSAGQTLEEVSVLTLTSFPYAILPNKLLQELRALVKGAEVDIILLDEVAADIFMGQFSGKFLEAAKRAANLLSGTLYANYYGIDYEKLGNVPVEKKSPRRMWFWSRAESKTSNGFAEFCASRAGVSLGRWDPATNGMIIEQQQILTTQNLAALFTGVQLTDTLRDRLSDMARECFKWICKRHQMKIVKRHARLIMLKNTAYAWRQMIFFISLLPAPALADFLHWAADHLEHQSQDFRTRFRPAMEGLLFAAEGGSLESRSGGKAGVRFLGWSNSGHWLLPDDRKTPRPRNSVQ